MGTSKTPAKLALPTVTGVPRLSFRHSATRWHGDSRAESPVILVHDLLASADAWSSFIRAVGQLPTQVSPKSDLDALTVKAPVDWFAVDLPFHGATASTSPIAPEIVANFVEISAERLVDFLTAQTDRNRDVGKVHLVGCGAGAHVCAMAALALQEEVASVTLLSPKLGLSEAMKAKLQLLRRALDSPGATLLSVDAALKQSVPNVTERTQLLRNVIRHGSSLQLAASATSAWDTLTVPAALGGGGGSGAGFLGNVSVFSTEPLHDSLPSIFPQLKHVQKTVLFNGDTSDVTVAVEVVEAMGLLGTVPIGSPAGQDVASP